MVATCIDSVGEWMSMAWWRLVVGSVVVIVGSCSIVRSCLWIIATPLPGFGDGYVIL